MTALDQLTGWPARHAAAGWATAGGAGARTGGADRPFPLASVTKPLAAYAVLVAVEEGTLSLDQPAGPPGSTIAHLLAHASGLGEDPAAPLAAPGRRRIYSNAGFDVLGAELARAAGMTVAHYVREAVAEPLGLSATALAGPSPAKDGVSTVSDLVKLGLEWLAPTLVHRSTLALATTPWLPDLVGVLPGFGRQDPNPWGLGFEIRGHKHPHWTGSANSPATFGHFGRAGTFLWVDPARRLVCCALTDEPFGPWATAAWPALSDAVIADAVIADTGQ